MTPVIWRTANAGDAEALAYLGAATFMATFAFDHPGQPMMEHLRQEHSAAYYAAALRDPATDILIGETPLGAPVGYAMITPPSHPALQQEDDIELKRIYLLGPWQGGGHGKDLLNLVFAVAEKHGAKRLLLSVYEKNARAIGFYERAGFAAIGETIFMVGPVPFRDLVYASNSV
ncbi:MAG: GNAT family N-acetyltransferase [Sphingomonadaceae bacterium]|jgi:ribosomal protein S18 acetylase RimI-like enzyme|uniref:GNAT family N-acetyltransferase n=1 Tax=Sphingorhabdus sp. TaxID=1902408 RepID=UPI002FDAA040|nr:GNAT family N-acetyltransferase [Sphingomonadaceae bacterium]